MLQRREGTGLRPVKLREKGINLGLDVYFFFQFSLWHKEKHLILSFDSSQHWEQLQNTPQLTPSLNLLLPWSAVRSRLARLYVCTKC